MFTIFGCNKIKYLQAIKSSKIVVFRVFRQIHKRTELGAEVKIPVFFSESPTLKLWYPPSKPKYHPS